MESNPLHKHLFIAEKPSLARTIADARGKMLGAQPKKGDHCIIVGDDAVTWVVGHVYELAPPDQYDAAYKRWGDLSKLPIVPDKWKRNPKENFIGNLNKIRNLIKNSDKLVNAGDAEREGQLLIDEMLEEMNVDPFSPKVLRFWAQSMTERDLIETLKSLFPNADKKNLSTAATLRQRADWLHGLNMTRLYTTLARNSGADMLVSVGRVQTPTLKLVVDRDREIANFKPVDHYTPTGFFLHENGKFKADWIIPKDTSKIDPDDKHFDVEGRLVDKAFAQKIADDIAGKTGKVEAFKSQNKSKAPPLPHSLATLQQECSKKLGLTAQETLDVAQALYEKHKATTYPRTETQHLPSAIHKDEAPGIMSALASCSGFEDIAGNADLKLKSAAFDDSKLSDHYGIIPTSEFSSSKLRAMSDVERKVFEIVAKSFIAQFYPAQTWKSNSAEISVGEHRFKANGRDPISSGWRVVYGAQADDDDAEKESDQSLPTMRKNDPVTVEKSDITSKRTKPPAHFTDGTLVEAMTNIHKFVTDPQVKKRLKENDGIGTGATRANIIETLMRRKFLQRKGGGKTKKILSTTAGQSVIDVLPREVVDPGLTSIWEAQLSKISKGEASAEQFTDVLIKTLNKFVEQGRQMGAVKVRGAETKALPGTGDKCPKCGKGIMITRTIHKGKHKGKSFLACNAWNKDDPNSCNHSKWPDDPKRQVKPIEGHGKPCPKCGKGKLVTRQVQKGEHKGKSFLSCDNWSKDNPNSCGHSEWPKQKVDPLPGHGETCSSCNKGKMVTRMVQKGDKKGQRFLSCDAYPNCKNSSWPDSNGGDGSGRRRKDSRR